MSLKTIKKYIKTHFIVKLTHHRFAQNSKKYTSMRTPKRIKFKIITVEQYTILVNIVLDRLT